MDDLYKFMAMARGENIATTELSHTYSSAEVNEIVNVIQKLYLIQKIVLKVNQQYILSAATANKFRTEPAFKLQGSYRNMNKMAEKIVAVMDDIELRNLVSDHYSGEAQLLTSDAEENLLKLAELRNVLSDVQLQRWEKIKKDYSRIQSTGGDDADAGTKVANQIAYLGEKLVAIQTSLDNPSDLSKPIEQLGNQFAQLRQTLAQSKLDIEVINQPLPGLESAFKALADTIDTTFMPVVTAMNHKIDLDLNILHKVGELSRELREFTDTGQNSNTLNQKIIKDSD
jgi:hypothetical protein